MTKFKITLTNRSGKAQNKPNPAYPNGMHADLSNGARVSCLAELPYPAEERGVWEVECQNCRLRVMVTAAGRVDDPKTVRLPCKLMGMM